MEELFSNDAIKKAYKPSSDHLLELDFNLKISDCIDIPSIFYHKSPGKIHFNLITSTGAIILCGYIIGLINGYSIILMLVLGCGLTFLFPLFICLISYKNFRKEGSVHYKIKFHNDEYTTIEYKSSVVNSFLWCDILKVEETRKVFFLYINEKDVYVIPKRLFKQKQEELKTFKKIISLIVRENKNCNI